MATLGLGEPVIDAIIAKLQAGYAARVATINAADTLGITLTVPGTADYYVGGSTTIPRAPAIIVAQAPTDGEHEAEGAHSFVWVADFLVAVIDEDYDRQKLARRLMRHARAVAEVLWDDAPREALTNAAHHLQFVRDDPGPVQDPADSDSKWRQMHLLMFRASRTEG